MWHLVECLEETRGEDPSSSERRASPQSVCLPILLSGCLPLANQSLAGPELGEIGRIR